MSMEFTGVKFIAEYFKKAGIKHVFGIPGHGNAPIIDELIDYSADIQFVPIKHEQWGGHMADGYFRANRKVPAVVTTSVGPGATNLSTALATAYVDSSTFIAITGEIQTYLFGMGIFQELDRQNSIDYINAMRHLSKRTFLVSNLKQLPRVLPNAHREAVGGRPGPVLIDLPMELQVEKIRAPIPDPPAALGRLYPDPENVQKAAKLLVTAERPLILIGGGVVMSDAQDELVKVAEFLGAPVASTFRGDAKGGFPEDHDLYVFSPGNVGSLVANRLALDADVILAIGTTFSDETTSSYAPNVTFNIPPSKLIHMDLDPREIGKNYPTAVGINSDAKAGLAALYGALSQLGRKEDYHKSALYQRTKQLKDQWMSEIEAVRTQTPMGIPSAVKIMRNSIPKSAIVSVSAGLPQEIMAQLWITSEPRTFLSSGGYSTMGFAFPAAMGAKLARPDRVAVAVEGDGSFMMNNVELLTAVQLKLPVVVVILNNFGWISIRDLQMRNFGGRIVGTDFK
ncbi:MAG TPA: thiamine pyrophosphate-binding protein, partial [Nitrososphaerales archaeon]|nr:thiamine pyrophosphate-binding protein [Nitrososphaerales archaeon]